jgi:hypothetical protein
MIILRYLLILPIAASAALEPRPDGVECPICLQLKSDILKLACTQIMCRDCFGSWQQKGNSTCPFCRHTEIRQHIVRPPCDPRQLLALAYAKVTHAKMSPDPWSIRSAENTLAQAGCSGEALDAAMAAYLRSQKWRIDFDYLTGTLRLFWKRHYPGRAVPETWPFSDFRAAREEITSLGEEYKADILCPKGALIILDYAELTRGSPDPWDVESLLQSLASRNCKDAYLDLALAKYRSSGEAETQRRNFQITLEKYWEVIRPGETRPEFWPFSAFKEFKSSKIASTRE